MFVSRLLLTATVFALLGANAVAAPTPTFVNLQNAVWQAGPIPGTQMAPIAGNPNRAGAFYAYLLRMRAGTRVPMHFHTMRETVTVLRGTAMFGYGSMMSPTMMTFSPGSVVSIPGGVHHRATAITDVVIEVSGVGPDTTTFVRH